MGVGGESVPPLTPEESAVLQQLDAQAEPDCSVALGARHPAEVALRCKTEGCTGLVLICRAHAAAAALHHLGHGLRAHMQGQLAVVSCATCGTTRETLEELVEVVAL